MIRGVISGLTQAVADALYLGKNPGVAGVAPAKWIDFTPNPTSDTLTIPVSPIGQTQNICINGPCLALAIKFPTVGVMDSAFVKIETNSLITAITNNVDSGLLIGALTTLLAGGAGIYQYRLSNKTWYKFQS